MPRCIGCLHCGKCGPASEQGRVELNPPGFCAFCKAQNAADAKRCASCGRPLPLPAGAASAHAASPAGGGKRP